MISKLWLSWEKTSTTEQEKSACSDVCWNWGGKRQGQQEAGRGDFGSAGETLGMEGQAIAQSPGCSPSAQ